MPRPADPKILGEQGECMFLYQAEARGLIVSKPFGDSARYDFVVQSRRGRGRSRPPLWCVQVKCTGVKRSKGHYSVHAGHHRPYLLSEVDFIAAWVIPADAWYIIPLAALPPVGAINLYPHGRRRRGGYEKYREAWHLLL